MYFVEHVVYVHTPLDLSYWIIDFSPLLLQRAVYVFGG